MIDTGLLVVGVDHGYSSSRSRENAVDVVGAEDDDGDALGRGRQSCVDETRQMGGISRTRYKATATAKETSQSSVKSGFWGTSDKL